jgi:hypothetical protein
MFGTHLIAIVNPHHIEINDKNTVPQILLELHKHTIVKKKPIKLCFNLPADSSVDMLNAVYSGNSLALKQKNKFVIQEFELTVSQIIKSKQNTS